MIIVQSDKRARKKRQEPLFEQPMQEQNTMTRALNMEEGPMMHPKLEDQNELYEHDHEEYRNLFGGQHDV